MTPVQDFEPRRTALPVISTDVGLDDALALLLLSCLAPARLGRVIATGGNTACRNVVANCAFLKEAWGLPGELFQGHDPPGAAVHAAEVHGQFGLADLEAPSAHLPPMRELVSAIAGSEGNIEILALGPATDVARLVSDPMIAGRVRRIMLMGAAFRERDGRLGNVTDFAEFNFYADPGAADAVLRSGLPCDVVPLDATESRLYTADELLEGLGKRPAAQLAARLVRHLCRAHQALGQGNGAYMHDVVAAAAWADTMDLQWRTARVERVIRRGPRRGQVEEGPTGTRVRYATGFNPVELLKLWRATIAGL